MVEVARSELILGGQKSGKSRRAELLARDWLMALPAHRAVLVATGQAWDDEMRERIARHQADRAQRVPGMATVEEPVALADALRDASDAQTLVGSDTGVTIGIGQRVTVRLAEAIPMTGGLMLELLELEGNPLPAGRRHGGKGGPRGRKSAALKAKERGVARKVRRSRKS